MTAQNSFTILTSGSPLLIILFMLMLVAFSYFVYKYTIPKVASGLRFILIFLRILILAAILFLIFEPVLSLITRNNVETKTYIYIDNSNSLASEDSLKRLKQTISFINELNSTEGVKIQFYSFGDKIDSLNLEKSYKINFGESKTNFADILENINKNNSGINSVVILSDGIITDGIDPTYQAEKLQASIFTIGIGDSTRKKDVEIYNVLYNQFVYSGKQTTIEVTVRNYGYENRATRVSFFEENKFIETKDLVLSETGLNRISFNYKPDGDGEKKLTVSISHLEGEASLQNNSRVFYLNVLNTRLRVSLISGTPSADLSSIAKALATNKNIQINKLIQISSDKFWNDVNPNLIDSADVLFMVDFPTSNTSQNLINKVSSVIAKNKPFFFLLSGSVNLDRLRIFEKELPFSFSRSANEFIHVQPELNSESFSSYFSTSNNQKNVWNNLPPVTQFSTEFSSKPGSNILVKSKVRNIPIGNPLIVTRSVGKQRVYAILAGDIWRWQLQTAERNPEFFDNFINDVVKWLRVSSNQKQFRITTDKKIYAPADDVEFRAELYDQTFSPIDSAKISAQVSYNQKMSELIFSPAGNGIYTSKFKPVEPGDYSFKGTAVLNGSTFKSETGRFNAGQIQIEKLDTRMNVEYLKLLANSTSGNYYSIESYKGLTDKLKRLNQTLSKEKVSSSEYQLWSYEWVLLFIILLFALEWFIRKRSGMI